jgi:hypothetical protein
MGAQLGTKTAFIGPGPHVSRVYVIGSLIALVAIGLAACGDDEVTIRGRTGTSLPSEQPPI